MNNDNGVFKNITYKNKVYNNDTVLSEDKISVDIDDINSAYRLFLVLGFSFDIKNVYSLISSCFE